MTKRILALLMILSLLCGCVSVLADEAVTVYTSDFSADEDGWYGRGCQSYRTNENTLKSIGRMSAWNSPGRDFDLIAAVIRFQEAAQAGLAAGVGVGGVEVVDAQLQRALHLAVGLLLVDAAAAPREAHAAEAQRGQ